MPAAKLRRLRAPRGSVPGAKCDVGLTSSRAASKPARSRPRQPPSGWASFSGCCLAAGAIDFFARPDSTNSMSGLFSRGLVVVAVLVACVIGLTGAFGLLVAADYFAFATILSPPFAALAAAGTAVLFCVLVVIVGKL